MKTRLKLQTGRILGQCAAHSTELTVFQPSFTSSGVEFHLSTVFLMKSFTQTREAAGRRSEVRARRLTTDCVKDQKHRGNELVGVASCSLGSVVSQRLHRRVDQWQNLSPCTGSLHHAALTCWSLTSQEEVMGVAKQLPGPSANSPSGGRNQRIRGSG